MASRDVAESMLQCSCSCDWDYDTADEYFESEPKARTKHVCVECRRAIEPGERYHLAKVKWEGSWRSHKTCTQCARIRADHCDCWAFGRLWDDLLEAYRTDYDDDGESLEETKGWLWPDTLTVRDGTKHDGM